jgi:hypothetical protein
MAAAITYTPDAPIEGRHFTCKRCHRQYAYPQPNDRPIRCECGWWYYNDGVAIRESYQQRIEPYRTPRNVRALFEKK